MTAFVPAWLRHSRVHDIGRATIASIIGQAPNALLPTVVAAYLGATQETDAFFLAFAFAGVVVHGLGLSIQQAAVPFFVKEQAEGSGDRFLAAATGMMAAAGAGSVAVVLLVGTLLLSGADAAADHRALAVPMLWLLAPFMLLSILASVWSSALNAAREYVVPAVSPALRTAIVILTVILLARRFGIYTVAAACVCGELARVGWIGFRVSRHYRLHVPTGGSWRRAESRAFLRNAAAQVAASATLALAPIVDRMMAAGLGTGAITVLDYAERLWQVPLAVFTSGFLIVSLSDWSHSLYGEGRRGILSSQMRRSARVLFACALPVVVAVAIFRDSIASLMVGHGRFPAAQVTVLADTLAVLMAVTPIYVVGLTYTRAFLALKRSEWILLVAVCMLAVKVILNVAFAPRFGLVGIAMSTTSMYLFSSVALVIIYHRRLAPLQAGDPRPV